MEQAIPKGSTLSPAGIPLADIRDVSVDPKLPDRKSVV